MSNKASTVTSAELFEARGVPMQEIGSSSNEGHLTP